MMISNEQQPPVATPAIDSTTNTTTNSHNNATLTSVSQMFDGKSIFITGASGFIGRVLLEKLLRTYQGIEKIYILMRVKRNMKPYDRLHKQLLQAPIFDRIKSMKNCEQLLSKIIVVSGDIAEPNLGISESNMQMLLNDPTLAVVFHSAATIKFDEPLKVSIQLNLVATKTVIELCRRLPNLLGLCHVSTAYVNSDMKQNENIEEKMYPMRENPEQMIRLSELMDENLMQTLKMKLVDQRPNTYTYTKALAEHLIALEASDLPVAIVRPSIVVASWKEPVAGWIDNLNGPTGLILAIGKGLIRSMHAKRDCKADIIPVDIVVNTMIASVYYAAKTKGSLKSSIDERQKKVIGSSTNGLIATSATDNNNHLADSLPITTIINGKQQKSSLDPICESPHQGHEMVRQNGEHQTKIPNSNSLAKVADGAGSGGGLVDRNNYHNSMKAGSRKLQTQQTIPIFHCNSGHIQPVTWGGMEDLLFPVIRKYPSCMVIRYPFGSFKSNKYHDFITRLFVHYLPALLIDLICIASGRKNLLGGKESNWQLLSLYSKLHGATGALTHFCTTNYNFDSSNWKKLRSILTNEKDRRELYMDIDRLDWVKFWESYVLGAR